METQRNRKLDARKDHEPTLTFQSSLICGDSPISPQECNKLEALPVMYHKKTARDRRE